MKIFLDYISIACFFVFYKFYGIYIATISAVSVSFVQLVFFYIKDRELHKVQFLIFCILFILGAMTFILHNPIYIKWKPTIICWIFASVILGGNFFSKIPMMKLFLGNKINLPDRVYSSLSISWMCFFYIMGILNLYVIYHYSTDIWVDFKFYGMFAITLFFCFVQALFISKHVIKN